MNLIMPTLGYRCTQAQMETRSAYISVASCTERESSRWDRAASYLFVWTHLLLDLSSLQSSLLISVEVYCGGAVHANKTSCFILPVLCAIHCCIFVIFILRSMGGRKNRNCQLLVHFKREMVQCGGEMEEDVLQRPVVKSWPTYTQFTLYF